MTTGNVAKHLNQSHDCYSECKSYLKEKNNFRVMLNINFVYNYAIN